MQTSSKHIATKMAHPHNVGDSIWRWFEMVFLGVTGLILWATSVAKLISVFHAADASRMLSTADPVFGFPNRNLMLISAGLEIAAVMAFLAPISGRVKCAIAAYVGVVFLAYRLALYLVGFNGWCACLGDFGKAVFINPSVQGGVLTAVGIWMVIAGTGLNLLRHKP